MAGVRLTLYIPGATSRKKAEELIKSVWPEARISRPYTKTKETEADKSSNQGPDVGDPSQDDRHQSNENDEYNVTHAGYKAVHYDIQKDLKKECGYGYEAGDRFEIQVVSLLLHGWQEAQHDVQYKTIAYGVPSNAEQRVLDAINGILLSGDLLLQQFYQMFYSRVYQRFNEVDDLARFLRDSDISQHGDLFPVQCHAHLFELLRKHDKNFPMAARECIKQLGAPDKTDLDVMGEELIPEPWIGFFCLAQRLEASCSVDPDYDAYDDPFKQGRAIIKTLVLLKDLSRTREFAGDILFRNIDSRTPEPNVVESLISLLAYPWVILFSPPVNQNLVRVRPKARILPTWTWFKSQGKNMNCFPGLVFRLVIREAVPAVTPYEALKRAPQLHADVVRHVYWPEFVKRMDPKASCLYTAFSILHRYRTLIIIAPATAPSIFVVGMFISCFFHLLIFNFILDFFLHLIHNSRDGGPKVWPHQVDL